MAEGLPGTRSERLHSDGPRPRYAWRWQWQPELAARSCPRNAGDQPAGSVCGRRRAGRKRKASGVGGGRRRDQYSSSASSIGRTLVSADRSDHWQQHVERLRGYPNHWSRPTGLGGDWWIVLACIRAKKFWSMPGPAVSVTLPYMVILPADIGNAPSR